MKKFYLSQMQGGWFVGNFSPCVKNIAACEVCCKHYKAGDYEERHVHKVAAEITLIARGSVMMNGQKFISGEIVLFEPGESTDFKALEDTINVVVKIPSVRNDKYLVK